MTPRRPSSAVPCAPRRGRQRGLVLVTGLLFLVVITLLALTLFRSTGLLERIAANTRDKQRSFEVAQSALQYGEYMISQGYGGDGSACDKGLVSGNTTANVHTCSNALSNPTSLPWANGYTYTPPNFSVATTGGETSTHDVNYQYLPGFYIEYLGMSTDGKSRLYTVTAYGYGGMGDTGTVVRSTYQMTQKTCDLSNLSSC